MGAQPTRVVVRAPGKITLSLAVGAPDHRGRHSFATVLQALAVHETVTATAGRDLVISVDSEVAGEVPTDGTNRALRAAELLRAECGVEDGAALHIRRQVPIAGGMGSGAADAAAALVALDRLWGLGLSASRLRELGSRLGTDVPFAMLGHTALRRDAGADLTTVLTHGEWTWLLAFLEGHLSTSEVCRRHDDIARVVGREVPEVPEIDQLQFQALSSGDAALLGGSLHNDLQSAVFALHPRSESVVEAAERAGSLGAIVSGAGPTIAILAEDPEHAQGVADEILLTGNSVDSCLITRGSVPGATLLEEI